MTPLLAPDAPPSWAYGSWPDHLTDYVVAVSAGFDEQWERDAYRAAEGVGCGLLSIRVSGDEALIGPLRTRSGPDATAGGCAGCAHARDQATNPGGTAAFGLDALVENYLAGLAAVPLEDGELVAINANGTVRRHRVRRTHRCLVCGGGEPRRPGYPARIPASVALTRRPTDARIPTRGTPPFGLDPARMRRELVDPRFGPVTRVRRKGRAPFAMTEVGLLGGEYPGYGRGRTFRSADAVAILEAFERVANTPQGTEVIENVTRHELGALAMDPATLGRYTDRQLAAPGCLIRPYAPDIAMDWIWSRRLSDGASVLVPAEVGFYRYAYPTGEGRKACFLESSSGSALGGSYEEATLHSLIELAERDAFLLAWHQGLARPRIDTATISDPECRMLIDLITGRGYDLHLLVATADLGIPVIWALAVHGESAFPATLSAAGASPDPVEAVRSALWELGQLVVAGHDLDEAAAQELAGDPWKILQLEDHVQYNALPTGVRRTQGVLAGPHLPLADAFDGWPQGFIDDAAGDVTGALHHVSALYAAAGLDEIFVVDQSSAEHRELGLSAVKAVVPGIVPMCFGYAHQRVAGIPRLARAIRAVGGDSTDDDLSVLDPHPFP